MAGLGFEISVEEKEALAKLKKTEQGFQSLEDQAVKSGKAIDESFVGSGSKALSELNKGVGAVGSGFSGMADLATKGGATSVGAISSIKAGLQSLFAMMIANPVIAILTAVVAIFGALIKVINSSEESSTRLQSVLAPLKWAFDKLLGALQKFVSFMLDGVEAMASFAMATSRLLEGLPFIGDAIKNINDGIGESIKLQGEKNQLVKDERNTLVSIAKNEKEIAELRAKAEDKSAHSANERLKYVKQANELERKNADQELNLANERLRIAKKESERNEGSTADNDNLARLQADVYKAEKDHEDKKRALKRKEEQLRQEIAADSKRALQEREKTDKATRDLLATQQGKLNKELYELSKVGVEDRLQLLELEREERFEAINKEISDTIASRKQLSKAEKDAFAERLSIASKYFDAKRAVIDKENTDKEKQSWIDYNKKYGDYQAKKLAITEHYAYKISKAKTDGEKAAYRKEQEKELSNLFTTLPEYNKFFTSIYSLTKDKAVEIGNLIKANLKEQLDKGTISVHEYYEGIKRINDELEKSKKGIDYFGKMQSGGVDGLLSSMRERADSDFQAANIDYTKYIDEYKKAMSMGDLATAKIANNNAQSAKGVMDGAENMQQFTGAAQGAVMMVDKIVTAIDQSVKATQRIVDVFADLAEQRGIDTSKGKWGEIRETMSIISAVNEKGKASWDSLKNGDLVGSLASTVEMVAIGFKSVNGEHKKALAYIEQQNDLLAHQYKLAQLRSLLEGKDSSDMFGVDKWGKANNAVSVYKQSVDELQKSMQALEEGNVVTGSKKRGWGPWRKRRDVWDGILSKYPELIKSSGEFDKSLAENILSTQQLDEAGEKAMKTAIDNASLVEEAYQSLNEYMTSIFGQWGQELTDAFVDAYRSGDIDSARDSFYDSTTNMLEKLIIDIAHSLKIAPLLAEAQKEIEAVMMSDKDQKQKGKQISQLISKYEKLLIKEQGEFNGVLDELAKEREGMFENKQSQQGGSKGYQVSMSQDTGDQLVGRATAMHMTGLSIDASVKSMERTQLADSVQIAQQTQLQQQLVNVNMQSMYYLQDITKYTSHIPAMANDMREVRTNTSNI